MDIITDLPKSFTTGEIDEAFMNEIKSGFKLEKETEHLRVAQATIPARDFFRLTQKYGHDQVHSKEFLKYYNKKFPELSPNQI
jgi:hypothetical protein